jgi:phospholipase C
MSYVQRKRSRLAAARRLFLAAAAAAVLATIGGASVASADRGKDHGKTLNKIDHIVVIYEENHSFDNLYSGWEGVNGLQNADAAHTIQIDQNGAPFACLPQNDANLSNAVPPAFSCTSQTGFTFPNWYFTIDDFIPATAITCPPLSNAFGFPFGLRNPGINPANGQTVPGARPGGCTRDLVHRYYQEIFQLNGGKQNQYVLGSDAIGTSMGVYDTTALPIYEYLHSGHHPHYAIADNFFQAAFGGSFLNHQWLIAAATPTFPDGPAVNHSILDARGFPNSTYPLYHPATTVRDAQLTQACGQPTTVAGFACGDFAVNTSQPASPPFGGGLQIPLQTQPTIGDRLTAAGIDWAWYAGGWDDAVAGHPDPLFQFHHQPFNYFANYAPGTPGRAHLQDEKNFIALANASSRDCGLKPVSFVKPIGAENEHPGYASEPDGSDHLVDLVQAIEGGRCAKNTMVIVTYDEFGGEWDHVPPPRQGSNNGPHDIWGPGTRIPALVIAPHLRGNFVVDHVSHDTTSILATIEHRYGLAPLSTRDAAVADLSSVFDAHQVRGQDDDDDDDQGDDD